MLVLPDGRSPELINAKSLGEMCANVNAEMVSPEETLSDKTDEGEIVSPADLEETMDVDEKIFLMSEER